MTLPRRAARLAIPRPGDEEPRRAGGQALAARCRAGSLRVFLWRPLEVARYGARVLQEPERRKPRQRVQRRTRRPVCGAALSLLLGVSHSSAAPPSGFPAAGEGEGPEPSTHGPVAPLGSDRVVWFPGRALYERYLADPRQPMMKGLVLHVLESETPEHGSPLMEFTMGGRVRLLAWNPRGNPHLGAEFSIHSAFLGRFDPANHYDLIGWDGYFGAMFAFRPAAPLGIKAAYQHDSAHVGDEYMQRTGRRRITYTREEIALGAIFDVLPLLRVYGEGGLAVHLGTAEGLRPWRWQAGLELDQGLVYGAIDANFWQERRYWPTLTAQIGMKAELPEIGRRYGFALQFEHGRSVLGEFYKDANRTIGGGIWFDL